MIGVMKVVMLFPLGVFFRRRRRRVPTTVPIRDPRAVAGRACCQACARDQRLGTMAPGTTCSPCAAAIAGCEVSPFDVLAVDEAIRRFAPGGIGDSSPEGVCLAVLQAVYPTDTNGTAIYWAALSPGDPWCLHALHHRVHARVCAGLAALHDASCDQGWRAAGLPVRGGR